MNNYIRLKIKKAFKNYSIGDIIRARVAKDGLPQDLYLRRRVLDSKFDDCVEIIKEEKPTKKSKKTQKTHSERGIEDGRS